MHAAARFAGTRLTAVVVAAPTYRVVCCLCCRRVQFSTDGARLWALALMQQPDTDSSTSSSDPPANQPDAVSSSVLCFSVASGSLLQQLPRPHGSYAVSHFCLDAAGAVLATCGADHLVKLWDVGGGCCTEGLPACQSFTAHHSAVAGVFVPQT